MGREDGAGRGLGRNLNLSGSMSHSDGHQPQTHKLNTKTLGGRIEDTWTQEQQSWLTIANSTSALP
jgi:hypothetical protein